jgi:hypothetical protein
MGKTKEKDGISKIKWDNITGKCMFGVKSMQLRKLQSKVRAHLQGAFNNFQGTFNNFHGTINNLQGTFKSNTRSNRAIFY